MTYQANPIVEFSEKQKKAFYSKIKLNTGTGCWEFQRFINPTGYGELYFNGKMKKAHRVSYEIHVGEIKEGMEIHHQCRNPKCCNPDHLEQVTRKENAEYSITKNSLKTHCPQGHPYSGNNLVINKLGRRICKICHKLRSRKIFPLRQKYFKQWRLDNKEKSRDYQRKHRESPKYLAKILLKTVVEVM